MTVSRVLNRYCFVGLRAALLVAFTLAGGLMTEQTQAAEAVTTAKATFGGGCFWCWCRGPT